MLATRSGASLSDVERWWRSAGLALALFCYGSAVRAGDAPTAEALFRAGREASNRGDPKTACERFSESYRLDAAPGTLLNIAACKEALHQLADAWENYLHVAESLPPDDDRLAFVKERLAALDAKLPRLTLQASGLGSSAAVLRDGTRLSESALGVPLPVDAGEHVILVSVPGRRTRRYVVRVAEGQHSSLRIEAGTPLPPEPPRRATVPSGPTSSLRRDAGYVLLGAGASALIAVGITGALYMQASSTADAHCPTPITCDDVGVKAAGSADRLQVAALVTGAVAFGAIAGGVTLWLFDRHGRRHTEPEAAVSLGAASVALRLRL
jgi:hypothetical protein